jgi:hypothetical protein
MLQMRALPSDVKSLVEELRVATQTALSSRVSRIDIEIPLGMGLTSGGKSQDANIGSRELARIFCEMFSQLEATTVVAFGSEPLAKAAAQSWGKGVKAKCIALAAPAGKKGASTSSPGFGSSKIQSKAAKPGKASANAGVPAGTEIVFAVGPFNAKGYSAVETISRRFDKSVLVVLLNAHLDNETPYASTAQRDYIRSEFERVFCFRPLVTSGDNPEELLVYRAFPGQWTLARMRSSGRPLPIAEQADLFSREELEQALIRAGPLEKGALEALGSLFSNFK